MKKLTLLLVLAFSFATQNHTTHAEFFFKAESKDLGLSCKNYGFAVVKMIVFNYAQLWRSLLYNPHNEFNALAEFRKNIELYMSEHNARIHVYVISETLRDIRNNYSSTSQQLAEYRSQLDHYMDAWHELTGSYYME